jgi:glutathione S-transferase
MTMKLYGSPFSPYVRKVRVLLAEKKIPCEFVIADPWPADSTVPNMNPLGKVPVLQIGPGNYLYDSALVLHYLDNLEGKPLPPQDAAGYWQAQWWQVLGNGIIDATIARLLELRRPEDKQMPEKMQREEARIARAFAAAERACKRRRFLVGAKFSLADLAFGVACQYVDLRYPHDWRAGHPRLKAWFGEIAARESFEETLPPGFAPVH